MESVKIEKSSWHYKMYELGRAMWLKWIGVSLREDSFLNVCAYLRTIMVYLPAMVVMNIGAITSPLWISYLMYSWFGIGAFGQAVFKISMIAIFITGFITVLALLAMLKDYLWKEKNKVFKKSKRKEEVRKEGKNLFTVFSQSLKDKHDMVCRPIETLED